MFDSERAGMYQRLAAELHRLQCYGLFSKWLSGAALLNQSLPHASSAQGVQEDAR